MLDLVAMIYHTREWIGRFANDGCGAVVMVLVFDGIVAVSTALGVEGNKRKVFRAG